MKRIINNNSTLVIASLLGVLCSVLWRIIFISKTAKPETINDGLTTYYIIYTALTTIPLSIFSSSNPWAIGSLLILGFYFSGLVLIPYFGQFGPFDLIPLFIFTMPSIIVAMIIKRLKTGMKTNQPKNA